MSSIAIINSFEKKRKFIKKNYQKKSIKFVSSRKDKAQKMGASSPKIKRMITKTQQEIIDTKLTSP